MRDASSYVAVLGSTLLQGPGGSALERSPRGSPRMSQDTGIGELTPTGRMGSSAANRRAPSAGQTAPAGKSVGESISEPDEVLVHCGPPIEQGLNWCAVM